MLGRMCEFAWKQEINMLEGVNLLRWEIHLVTQTRAPTFCVF